MTVNATICLVVSCSYQSFQCGKKLAPWARARITHLACYSYHYNENDAKSTTINTKIFSVFTRRNRIAEQIYLLCHGQRDRCPISCKSRALSTNHRKKKLKQNKTITAYSRLSSLTHDQRPPTATKMGPCGPCGAKAHWLLRNKQNSQREWHFISFAATSRHFEPAIA